MDPCFSAVPSPSPPHLLKLPPPPLERKNNEPSGWLRHRGAEKNRLSRSYLEPRELGEAFNKDTLWQWKALFLTFTNIFYILLARSFFCWKGRKNNTGELVGKHLLRVNTAFVTRFFSLCICLGSNSQDPCRQMGWYKWHNGPRGADVLPSAATVKDFSFVPQFRSRM